MFSLKRDQRQQIDESGPLSRPALPQRLIVVPDPPHANRPLPPTPKSSDSVIQTPPSSQQQRNLQNNFKPTVCLLIKYYYKTVKFIIFFIYISISLHV